MRKLIAMFVVCCLVLCGCAGGQSKEDSARPIIERVSNNNMTDKQMEDFNKNYGKYVKKLGKVYSQIISLMTKQKKADKYQLSQTASYEKVKKSAQKVCDEVLKLDDKVLSTACQRCQDECKQMANYVNNFWEASSEEITAEQMKELCNGIYNEVTVGMKQAEIYWGLANIHYLEDTNGDQKQLRKLQEQYGDRKLEWEEYSNVYDKQWVKCSHAGCNLEIALTGDSSCCTIHSQKCLECGKNVTENNVYCRECEKALEKKEGDTE